MALTTRPISQLQNARFQAAIFPLPVIQSFWASFSTSWSLQFAKVKHYFKLDTNADGAQSSLPRGMTSLDQLQENNAKREPQSPNRMDKMSDPKAAEDNPARGSSKPNPKDPFPDRSKILTNLPTIQSISGDNGAAMTAFKRTLAKNWKPPHEFGERGTLLVSGLVQLEGPKGICVLDVQASYHPKESRYTYVACGIRSFRPRQQRPRGGP